MAAAALLVCALALALAASGCEPKPKTLEDPAHGQPRAAFSR